MQINKNNKTKRIIITILLIVVTLFFVITIAHNNSTINHTCNHIECKTCEENSLCNAIIKQLLDYYIVSIMAILSLFIIVKNISSSTNVVVHFTLINDNIELLA